MAPVVNSFNPPREQSNFVFQAYGTDFLRASDAVQNRAASERGWRYNLTGAANVIYNLGRAEQPDEDVIQSAYLDDDYETIVNEGRSMAEWLERKYGPLAEDPYEVLDSDTANKLFGLGGRLTFDEDTPYMVAKYKYELKRDELKWEYIDKSIRGIDWWQTGGIELLMGIADPLGWAVAAPFEMAIVGPAQLARIATTKSAISRFGQRATLGAQTGVATAALIEPPIIYSAQLADSDYTFADSLANIVFSGIFGGALFSIPGGVYDSVSWWRQGPSRRLHAAVMEKEIQAQADGKLSRNYSSVGTDNIITSKPITNPQIDLSKFYGGKSGKAWIGPKTFDEFKALSDTVGIQNIPEPPVRAKIARANYFNLLESEKPSTVVEGPTIVQPEITPDEIRSVIQQDQSSAVQSSDHSVELDELLRSTNVEQISNAEIENTVQPIPTSEPDEIAQVLDQPQQAVDQSIDFDSLFDASGQIKQNALAQASSDENVDLNYLFNNIPEFQDIPPVLSETLDSHYKESGFELFDEKNTFSFLKRLDFEGYADQHIINRTQSKGQETIDNVDSEPYSNNIKTLPQITTPKIETTQTPRVLTKNEIANTIWGQLPYVNHIEIAGNISLLDNPNKISYSGSRELYSLPDVKDKFEKIADGYAARGYVGVSGGAFGADNVAFYAQSRGGFNIVYIPEPIQDYMAKSGYVQQQLIEFPDDVLVVSMYKEKASNKQEYVGRLFERNKLIVDTTDNLIAVSPSEKGGTRHAIDYATKQGKQIYEIDSLGNERYLNTQQSQQSQQSQSVELDELLGISQNQSLLPSKTMDLDVQQYPNNGRTIAVWKSGDNYGLFHNMAGKMPMNFFTKYSHFKRILQENIPALNLNAVEVKSSEALYQAMKFTHSPKGQQHILDADNGYIAKLRSQEVEKHIPVRADWEHIKVDVMRWVLRAKLSQNFDTISKSLLSTGHRFIVEGSYKDNFWGANLNKTTNQYEGSNMLGRLWMEIRDELRQDPDKLKIVPPLTIPDFKLVGKKLGRFGQNGNLIKEPVYPEVDLDRTDVIVGDSGYNYYYKTNIVNGKKEFAGFHYEDFDHPDMLFLVNKLPKQVRENLAKYGYDGDENVSVLDLLDQTSEYSDYMARLNAGEIPDPHMDGLSALIEFVDDLFDVKEYASGFKRVRREGGTFKDESDLLMGILSIEDSIPARAHRNYMDKDSDDFESDDFDSDSDDLQSFDNIDPESVFRSNERLDKPSHAINWTDKKYELSELHLDVDTNVKAGFEYLESIAKHGNGVRNLRDAIHKHLNPLMVEALWKTKFSTSRKQFLKYIAFYESEIQRGTWQKPMFPIRERMFEIGGDDGIKEIFNDSKRLQQLKSQASDDDYIKDVSFIEEHERVTKEGEQTFLYNEVENELRNREKTMSRMAEVMDKYFDATNSKIESIQGAISYADEISREDIIEAAKARVSNWPEYSALVNAVQSNTPLNRMTVSGDILPDTADRMRYRMNKEKDKLDYLLRSNPKDILKEINKQNYKVEYMIKQINMYTNFKNKALVDRDEAFTPEEATAIIKSIEEYDNKIKNFKKGIENNKKKTMELEKQYPISLLLDYRRNKARQAEQHDREQELMLADKVIGEIEEWQENLASSPSKQGFYVKEVSYEQYKKEAAFGTIIEPKDKDTVYRLLYPVEIPYSPSTSKVLLDSDIDLEPYGLYTEQPLVVERIIKDTIADLRDLSRTYTADEIESLSVRAKEGDDVAQYELAEIYYWGKGVDQDDDKAFRLYTVSADAGNADAMFGLGWFFHNLEKSKVFKAPTNYTTTIKADYTIMEPDYLISEYASKKKVPRWKMLRDTYGSGWEDVLAVIREPSDHDYSYNSDQLKEFVNVETQLIHALNTVYKNQGKETIARKWFTRAANKGHELAHYILGWRYNTDRFGSKSVAGHTISKTTSPEQIRDFIYNTRKILKPLQQDELDKLKDPKVKEQAEKYLKFESDEPPDADDLIQETKEDIQHLWDDLVSMGLIDTTNLAEYVRANPNRSDEIIRANIGKVPEHQIMQAIDASSVYDLDADALTKAYEAHFDCVNRRKKNG